MTRDGSRPIRVLMVCLGNICRSPMAEAVFRDHVRRSGLEDRIEVASAGTGTWHVGERPHAGTLGVLARHDLALAGKQAAHIDDLGWRDYDVVVAMDRANARDLGGRAVLLLDFAEERPADPDVPDPYYSGAFDRVYELVDAGSRGLLRHLVERYGLQGAP